ncbi:MAG: hypothetical protein R2791_03030 [Saprospiraceae bacterium]
MKGIDEAIITGFTMAVINENRIKNADIIAGITKSDSKPHLTVQNVLGQSR